jgi:protein-tyrosine phosphatase
MGEPVMNVLTVCLGNVCRSPLAERLLDDRLRAAGAGDRFLVSSAGVIAMAGHEMEPNAAEQLVRLGGDPAGFVARQLRASHVNDAGLVLTATVEVRRRVLEEAPGALRRTFTLREFAALVSEGDPSLRGDAKALIADAAHRRSTVGQRDLDIPDPMGRSVIVHAEAAQLIDEAVAEIAKALAV